MNLLLDTHIALWAITDDCKLPDHARNLIQAPKSTVWISAASIWEITIKHSLGRSKMPVSGGDAMEYFREAGYQFLAIKAEHAAMVQDLANHHQDPFDRIIIAQALYEPMHLMTRDATVALYSNAIIRV